MGRPRPLRALVSGAGIAGLTLAYWLTRAGIGASVIEKAPALRTGGYMIDFWGAAFDVAEQMHIDGHLRQIGYSMTELRALDTRGRVLSHFSTDTIRHLLQDRYVTLLRGDLAGAIFAAAQNRVEITFGAEVTSLIDDGRCVTVEFTNGRHDEFDLVFGADGLHSRVRRLLPDLSSVALDDLGYCVAAFTARNFPARDESVYVSRTVRGRQVAYFSLRDGRTVFFVFMDSKLLGSAAIRSVDEQKNVLRAVIGTFPGAPAAALLAALDASDDLYFDTVSQVHLPAWSRGRVALVGDAAYCPSLLAGEGAAFAMLGAYVLAGELAGTMEPPRAFAAYEAKLRPLIERKQRGARRLGGWFAPRTGPGLIIRDLLTRLASNRVIARALLERVLRTDFELPEYCWPVAGQL
jgi:2-polyprenyl-6-methoxyphenol hydroxylase-like FAD-dependent oxidoreductase